MWTAHFLKRADPSLDIHIVEADYAGAGASGHNDGFVTPTIGHSLGAVVNRFGIDAAQVAYAAVTKSVFELGRFCSKYEIDAEIESSGYFQVASNIAQIRLLERDLKIAGRLGVDSSLELLDARQAQQKIGSPAIKSAIKIGGALINPHRLARGLARVVTDHRVHIHEQTRATAVARAPGGHQVTTPEGTIRAPIVVLATNAYQHQFAPFRRKVVPVWSYAAVTEPLTGEQLRMVHWPGREGFVEAGNFIVFGRLTAENRLLFGGGRAHYHYGRDMNEHRHLDSPAATEVLRGVLARYFPVWQELRFTHAYGGCVAITREVIPHAGAAGDGLFYGHGYCGNGIAVTHTTGKVLRDLILGRNTTYANLLFANGKEKPFPPEPFAFVAAKAMSLLLTAQDRHPQLIRRQLT
jgi:glycine/D-amino acid oxidase-like deaminating enzyme